MVTSTVAAVPQNSAAEALVFRDGQAVAVAPLEVLRVGDRVVTGGQAMDVMVPTASGAKSVLLRVAPNSEVVVRPPQADGGKAPADIVVINGDAEFVGLPDDLGEPVSILKKTKSSTMLASEELGGLAGGLLLPLGAGLAGLTAVGIASGSSSGTPATAISGSVTPADATGATGATGDTVAEVENEIREAIRFHIDGLQADGIAVPPPTSIAEYVET